jgi:hypothetical protein
MPDFQKQDTQKTQENAQVKDQVGQAKEANQKTANPFLPPNNPASTNPFVNPNGNNTNPFLKPNQTTQNADNQPIQRETQDSAPKFTLMHTTGHDKTDIDTIKDIAPAVTRVIIISGNILKLYNAIGGHLIYQFTVKADVVNTIPQIYYLISSSKFYPLAVGEMGVTALAKPEKLSEADQKVMDALDKSLTTDNWFLTKQDADKCYEQLKGGQVIYLAVSKSGKGAAAGADGGEQEEIPPRPKWTNAYEKEMNQLLEARRKAEPAAEDLPASFSFYYSKSRKTWRGFAAQKDPSNKLINKVYVDVEQKTDKNQLLDLLRTKTRIAKLDAQKDSVTEKDAKILKPEMLWAYEMKRLLEARIIEEKQKLPNALDLPDKIALVMPKDDANKAFLQLYVYIDKINEEGVNQKELKTGVLPEPLNKDLKQDDLLATIRKATLGLRGMIKTPTEKPKEKKDRRILAPYPAQIIPKNVREDGRTITGANNEFDMKLDFAALEGNDLLHLATVNMRTVYYSWDIYNVKDQLNADEYAKLPADWDSRRSQLKNYFSPGRNVKETRIVNEAMLSALNKMNKATNSPEVDPTVTSEASFTVDKLKQMGVFYGTATKLTPDAEIKIPKAAGDYVIYCRALVQPSDAIYRMPSEQFFPIRVEDGYKLAHETVDAGENEAKKLENELKEAKTEEEKKEIQDKIDLLKKGEETSLKDRTKARLANNQAAIKNAEDLKQLYIANKKNSGALPFAILEKYPVKKNKNDVDENAVKRKDLMELWLLACKEEHQQKKPLDKILDLIIENLKKMGAPIKDLQDRLQSFDKEVNYKEKTYTPIVSLISEVTGNEYKLITMIGETPDSTAEKTRVVLLDLTSKKTQGKYFGESTKTNKQEALAEAIQKAFIDFGEECKYGQGYIAYRTPGVKDGKGQNRSKPGPWQQVKSALEAITMVAGLAALAIGTVATGGALGAAALAIGLGSAAIGAGIAAHNIYDRVSNNRFEFDVEFAMDVLNILSPFLAGAGVLNKMKMLGQVGKGLDTLDEIAKAEKLLKINKGIMFLQKGELVTNITLFGTKVYLDLKEIEESKDMTPEQKEAMRMQILKNALVAGVMFGIAVKNELKPSASMADAALEQKISSAREKYYENLKLKDGLINPDGALTTPKGKPVTSVSEGGIKPKPAEPEIPITNEDKAKGGKIINPPPLSPKSPAKPLDTRGYIDKYKTALLRGNKDSIKGLLKTHGNWKDLIITLQKGNPTDLKILVEVEKFRLRTSEELKVRYNADELAGASREAVSDIDLNFKGVDAGLKLAQAEAEMRSLFGNNWSKDLRMNFYTEGRRLTLFSEVAGMLGKDAVAAFQSKVTDLTKKYALAKMLKHAKGNPESEARVQKMIEKIAPGDAPEIKKLSEISTADSIKRRDELHAEVDTLMKEYNQLDANDPKRAEIAKKVVEKQMEINLHTEEAYIGPGAIPAMDEALKRVQGNDSMQAVLANMEMIEHILHQHGGDIVKAGKEYEIYKYMYRVSKAISKDQGDLFFDWLNKFISKIKNKDGSNNRNVPQQFDEAQIKLLWEDFNNYVNKFLQEQSTTPKTDGGAPKPDASPKKPDSSPQLGLFDNLDPKPKSNSEPIKPPQTVEPDLKPKGFGNTGRTEPNSLFESLAMQEIMGDPKLGRAIKGMPPLGDKRWKDWTKMEFMKRFKDGTKVDVHFVAQFDASGKMIAVDDFKFKFSSVKPEE